MPLSPVSPRRRLVALVTAAVLAGTTLLPPVGAPAHAQPLPELGDVAQASLSLVQERKLGEAIMRQARAFGGFLEDPEVVDYLNLLGNRLLAVSGDTRQEFEFFAVPDNSINAFALPGGFIGVNTGLILLAQNESELAAVLAHEITHVTQRHIARMLQNQQTNLWTSLATVAVALLAARAGGRSSGDAAQAALMTGQALAIQNQLNYTREFEFEADRIGFGRLSAAGFDVRASATFMERLQRSSRYLEGSAPSYLRTHPVTFERIAEAQSRADAFSYRQVTDSLDFHMVRALLRSYQGEPAQTVRDSDTAIAEGKFNNEIAARYGLVASLVRAGNLSRAKAELAVVEKLAPPHPMVEAMAAHVLLANGEIDAAVKRIEAALVRYPNKMQLVYDYPEALLKAKRPQNAVTFVEAQLVRLPNDGPLHRIAARAYADLGRQLKQHYHQGQYYAWQGNTRAAIEQFEIALKSGDANFYESSVVETRLRALRREMVEQQKEGFGRSG